MHHPFYDILQCSVAPRALAHMWSYFVPSLFSVGLTPMLKVKQLGEIWERGTS